MEHNKNAQLQQTWFYSGHLDGLVQERRNCIANAMELRLSCTNPSVWFLNFHYFLVVESKPW